MRSTKLAIAAAAAAAMLAATGAAFAGAPSGYLACAGEKQLYEQAKDGQTTVKVGVARTFYEQCLKDHRYDGGETHPFRREHECSNSKSCM